MNRICKLLGHYIVPLMTSTMCGVTDVELI